MFGSPISLAKGMISWDNSEICGCQGDGTKITVPLRVTPYSQVQIYGYLFLNFKIKEKVDPASKNQFQNTSGGKDGRFVRLTTLPPS